MLTGSATHIKMFEGLIHDVNCLTHLPRRYAGFYVRDLGDAGCIADGSIISYKISREQAAHEITRIVSGVPVRRAMIKDNRPLTPIYDELRSVQASLSLALGSVHQVVVSRKLGKLDTAA